MQLSDAARRILTGLTNTYIETGNSFMHDLDFHDVPDDDLVSAVTELQALRIPVKISKHRPGKRYISAPVDYISQAVERFKSRQQQEGQTGGINP